MSIPQVHASRRGRVRMLASLLALVLALVACGGDDEDTGAGTDAGDAADSGETESAPDESDDSAPDESDNADDGGSASGGVLESELISMVVPFSAGGGYDTDGRLVGEFLAEELAADVVVENEPGAGGLLAINRISSLSGEATTISIANGTGLGGAALADVEGMEFALTDLTYLARHGYDPKVLAVSGDAEWESIDDFMADADNIRWGATGPGASTYVDVYLMAASLGLDTDNLDIVTGFDGGSEVEAAIVAGEVDAMVSSVSGRLPLLESGDLRPIIIAGREPYEGLEDVPLIMDVEMEGDQEQIANDFLNNNELGRPILGPPDMPEDAVAEYRSAFENIYNDEEFLAEAESRGRDIAFMPGEEYEELVAGFNDASETFKEVLQKASQ